MPFGIVYGTVFPEIVRYLALKYRIAIAADKRDMPVYALKSRTSFGLHFVRLVGHNSGVSMQEAHALKSWKQLKTKKRNPGFECSVTSALLIILSIVLWLIDWSRRAARYDRNPWEKPVPFWQRWQQEAIVSGNEFRKRLATRRETLALPPAPPVRVIEAIRIEPKQVLVKLVSEQRRPLSEASRVAARPTSHTKLWDESKGL